jgi:hypothetical protein
MVGAVGATMGGVGAETMTDGDEYWMLREQQLS